MLSPGHVGTVYQASNALYTGRSTARTLTLLPDGTVISDRALSKIRKREKGWRYAVEQLVTQGARPPAEGQDLGSWLREVKPMISRRTRHPGNHRYVWGLDRTMKRALEPHLRARGVMPLPYPKVTIATG
jgi:hypothetical protein